MSYVLSRWTENRMIQPTPDFEWVQYFESAERGNLNPLYERLEPHLHTGHSALDLGCGVGHGTIYLCNKGLQVTAVDVFQEALDRLQAKLPDDHPVTIVKSDFASLDYLEYSFDVVAAVNALYFVPPGDFDEFWQRLVGWIKPGGFFAGNFMGPNDPWSEREDYSRQTKEEVRLLLRDFEILHEEEILKDHLTVNGAPTRSHNVQIVARKN